MNRLIENILTYPKNFISISLIATFFCIPGLLQMEQNYSYRNWFNAEDPILKTQDQFESEFGSLDTLNILLVFNKSVFNKPSLEYIKRLTQELEKLPYTTRVDNLTNVSITYSIEDDIIIESLVEEENPLTPFEIEKIRTRALSDPIISKNYLFDNEKAILINYRFKRDYSVKKSFNTIVMRQVEKIMAQNSFEGLASVHMLGNPKITTTFRTSAMQDLSVLVPVLLILIALLIFVQFRKIQIVAISFISIIMSITIMLGIMSYLGIYFNNLTSITPELVLAIGLADSIHIFATFSLKIKSMERIEALRYSMRKNFIPTLLTSLTTALGFIAFVNSEMDNIADLGLIASIGTLIAWLVTYFFLAPLTSLIVKDVKLRTYNFNFDAQKLIDYLLSHKFKIYLFYGVCVIVSLALVPGLEINSDPVNYFRGELDFSRDIKVADKKMGGVFPLEVVFDSGLDDGIKNPDFLKQVDDYIQWVYSTGYVKQDLSVIKILKNMNKVFNQNQVVFDRIPDNSETVAQLLFTYNLSVPEGRNLNDRVTLNNKKIRVTFMTPHLDSKTGQVLYSMLRAEAKKRSLKIIITGKRYLWHALNQKVVFSFLKSLGTALILVTLLLTVFLRSLKLGLLSLIPNLVPIVSGSLFLTIMSRPLDIGSSIVASIVLGIAVDDTIHVITNYKIYMNELGDERAALIKLFSETAPALIITTLILSISFACFMLASFVPNQNMGILMSLSLLFALICDLTLLPLILFDLVKKVKP